VNLHEVVAHGVEADRVSGLRSPRPGLAACAHAWLPRTYPHGATAEPATILFGAQGPVGAKGCVMSRWFWLVAFLTAAAPASAVPFEELLYKGKTVPFYSETRAPQHERLEEAVKRSRMAESMAQVAGAARLRRDLGVGFASCGRPNAFFDSRRSAVVVCYELIELMANLARADGALKLDRAGFARMIDGALWGIFFHELGHAIININRVPITGREEDVADQFALYFATNFVEPRGVPVVVPTVWLFQQMAKRQDVGSPDQESIKRLMSNEHSLDQQRVYNLACWGYGANSPGGLDAAREVGLPEERARRCPGEYALLDRAFKRHFQKYFRVRPQ
jgi:hypothetical protein